VKSHIIVAVALIAALGMPVRAQEKAAIPSTTLRVQMVLSRFQGEKKISSLPFTLTINADDRNRNSGRGTLRLGTQVPVTTMVRQNNDSNAPMVPTVQYKDVGTNIDCGITAIEDGRFKLDVTIEDSSVDTTPGTGSSAHPTFRSFRTNDTMLLRDGQSAQYSTATDKVSGDVWKVDVTLTVVK
jgi:type II/III secretion system protein